MVEAARYALLRRLAPVLRHNLAGALQPLSMISLLLEKRLQKPDPDLSALAKNSAQLGSSARDASAACMDLMTWLTPKAGELTTVTMGVADVAGLVMTELSFRGFNVVNQLEDIPTQLPRSLTRNVYMAALIALTDSVKAPANVVLDAALVNGVLVLTISVQALQGDPPPNEAISYRNLEWEDVLALAEVESVDLLHTETSAELRYKLDTVGE